MLKNFADDRFNIAFDTPINNLIADLEMITKWFKDSGFKVNEN
jgi:hypothetical protein